VNHFEHTIDILEDLVVPPRKRDHQSLLWLPSHIGFLPDRLQVQNQASSAAAGLYSTGVKLLPLCEPSQKGCDFERPQAHHQ
jgi:hypothetical protein